MLNGRVIHNCTSSACNLFYQTYAIACWGKPWYLYNSAVHVTGVFKVQLGKCINFAGNGLMRVTFRGSGKGI